MRYTLNGLHYEFACKQYVMRFQPNTNLQQLKRVFTTQQLKRGVTRLRQVMSIVYDSLVDSFVFLAKYLLEQQKNPLKYSICNNK